MRAKLAQAVALEKLQGTDAMSWALGHAAIHGRLGEGDGAAMVTHRASA